MKQQHLDLLCTHIQEGATRFGEIGQKSCDAFGGLRLR
ncbi:hypothetical protein GXM_09172 [Nostoc sphaeroides CCNUC1]|uniref:Uncharacterized protein n=1 Tax=Nostoc sphaeroides CCNUC1 TaxID=2653204 RepID=A0A5P8WFX4_9NOSO|nr:hypothetical protein GXM_09172 [Nostoc sphaeroides CCNUC1]